ncbi:MAG: hypothetical protein Q8M20_05545 [Rhodocyclaceae bacterium]|nr:hypothetical protein [Rhodocyclaceae bacterium]MDZ4214227.1 hypothetical protein [Rhodocyclaceae bacterium]
MTTILIALVLLIVAVGAIYLILKNMGEEGIEVAAPGSCKSGRCGVRCAPATEARDEEAEEKPAETEEVKRKESA